MYMNTHQSAIIVFEPLALACGDPREDMERNQSVSHPTLSYQVPCKPLQLYSEIGPVFLHERFTLITNLKLGASHPALAQDILLEIPYKWHSLLGAQSKN